MIMRRRFLILAACPIASLSCANTGKEEGSSSALPVSQEALTGKTWVLKSMVDGGKEIALEKDTKLSISFGKEGEVKGHSGVNSFASGYTLDASSGKLTWTKPFRQTRRAGPPELMKQESTFIKILRQTDRLHQRAQEELLFTSHSSGKSTILTFAPGK